MLAHPSLLLPITHAAYQKALKQLSHPAQTNLKQDGYRNDADIEGLAFVQIGVH